ncbi:MAG TPA: hypothetical protein VGX70_20695 [Gemmataceae bacterium]|jgi:hypothetical protein|nr:hypothetical protein [Gemmataceae bacterium]
MKLANVTIAVLAVLMALIAQAKSAEPETKTVQLEGKVVPMAAILEKFGSRLDPEAAPHWLALVTKDGKTYPLIKDDGSRLFFSDPRLQNRAMRISGRLFQDTHLLQVLSVNSVKNGQLHEIYYWCDICSIRRNELLKKCDCCGGPMELREEPVKK